MVWEETGGTRSVMIRIHDRVLIVGSRRGPSGAGGGYISPTGVGAPWGRKQRSQNGGQRYYCSGKSLHL